MTVPTVCVDCARYLTYIVYFTEEGSLQMSAINLARRAPCEGHNTRALSAYTDVGLRARRRGLTQREHVYRGTPTKVHRDPCWGKHYYAQLNRASQVPALGGTGSLHVT